MEAVERILYFDWFASFSCLLFADTSGLYGDKTTHAI